MGRGTDLQSQPPKPEMNTKILGEMTFKLQETTAGLLQAKMESKPHDLTSQVWIPSNTMYVLHQE